MSINSKAKRDKKKRLLHAAWQKRQHNEFPHQMCNWPKCKERSYTFKRCRYHRLRASLFTALSRGTKKGIFERIGGGVYALPGWDKGEVKFIPSHMGIFNK